MDDTSIQAEDLSAQDLSASDDADEPISVAARG
jgi:hypothetical protein